MRLIENCAYGVVSTILLLTDVGCGRTKATTYYAVAISADAERVAYVERVAEYTLLPGGGVFSGHGPIRFADDRLFVCTATRKLDHVECPYSWQLPLAKKPDIEPGQIRASVRWEAHALLYWICVLDIDGTIPGSDSCVVPGNARGSLLTNTDSEEPLVPMLTANGWHIWTDPEQKPAVLPKSNSIIIDQTEAK